VNKLAAWLDPSCTHIKKQTYEDMCVLRDRLNDNFEYSGDLNQDFLRGLLGKAVTRRRTDLISYIMGGGKQPLSFDDKIWKRMEKLAGSIQREESTEHGRYANKCRRTLGRTSASGENGVRLRLNQQYGRSPDPNKVAEEMQRDKGHGKKYLEERRNVKRDRTLYPDEKMQDQSLQIELRESDEEENGLQVTWRSSTLEVFRRKIMFVVL